MPLQAELHLVRDLRQQRRVADGLVHVVPTHGERVQHLRARPVDAAAVRESIREGTTRVRPFADYAGEDAYGSPCAGSFELDVGPVRLQTQPRVRTHATNGVVRGEVPGMHIRLVAVGLRQGSVEVGRIVRDADGA